MLTAWNVMRALPELERDRSAGQPALLLGLRVALSQRRIIDEPDLGEPVQNAIHSVAGHALLAQRCRQLGPGPCLALEQS